MLKTMQTLQVVDSLLQSEKTIEELEEQTGIPIRNLRRRLHSAKEMGAYVYVKRPKGRKPVYYIANADEVRKAGKVQKWLQLEMEKTLI